MLIHSKDSKRLVLSLPLAFERRVIVEDIACLLCYSAGVMSTLSTAAYCNSRGDSWVEASIWILAYNSLIYALLELSISGIGASLFNIKKKKLSSTCFNNCVRAKEQADSFRKDNDLQWTSSIVGLM